MKPSANQPNKKPQAIAKYKACRLCAFVCCGKYSLFDIGWGVTVPQPMPNNAARRVFCGVYARKGITDLSGQNYSTAIDTLPPRPRENLTTAYGTS